MPSLLPVPPPPPQESEQQQDAVKKCLSWIDRSFYYSYPRGRKTTRNCKKRMAAVMMPWMIAVCCVANTVMNGRRLRKITIVSQQERVLNEFLLPTTLEAEEPSSSALLTTTTETSQSRDDGHDDDVQCFPWDIYGHDSMDTTTDSWWMDHPDWEIHHENITHTCFHPIQGTERAKFVREMNTACTSGWFDRFMMSLGLRGNNQPSTTTTTTPSPYFLPIHSSSGSSDGNNQNLHSSCFSLLEWQSTKNLKWKLSPKKDSNQTQQQSLKLQDAWFYSYSTRPRQSIRKRVIRQMEQLLTTSPNHNIPRLVGGYADCTWIRVHRSNSTAAPASSSPTSRSILPLDNYLKTAQVQKGSVVFLWTDNELAEEEAKWLHPQYKWLIWNQQLLLLPQQQKGKGEEENNLFQLLLEIQLAKQCSNAGVLYQEDTLTWSDTLLQSSIMLQQRNPTPKKKGTTTKMVVVPKQHQIQQLLTETIRLRIERAKEIHHMNERSKRHIERQELNNKKAEIAGNVLKMMEMNAKKYAPTPAPTPALTPAGVPTTTTLSNVLKTMEINAKKYAPTPAPTPVPTTTLLAAAATTTTTTDTPTSNPTPVPTSVLPLVATTDSPTSNPTKVPTLTPTPVPTSADNTTDSPTSNPTLVATSAPSQSPPTPNPSAASTKSSAGMEEEVLEQGVEAETSISTPRSSSNSSDTILDQVVRLLLPPAAADVYIQKYPGDSFHFYLYELPDPYNYQAVSQCIADRFPKNASNCDWSSICTEEYANDVLYSKRRFNRNGDVVLAKILSNYNGPLRTRDPQKADLFIVPYPSAGNCECHSNRKNNSNHNNRCHKNIKPEELRNFFQTHLKYYNQDDDMRYKHLFLVSNIYMDMHTYMQDPRNIPLVTTIGPALGCSVGSSNPLSQKYCGQIVMPYANLNERFQPPNLLSNAQSMDQLEEERPNAIAVFVSTNISGNGRARVRIMEQARDLNYTLAGRPIVTGGMRRFRTMRNETSVQDAYKESIFCPVLRGDYPPQKRLFDVMLAGCIPVVLESQSAEVGVASHFAKNSLFSTRVSYPFGRGIFPTDGDDTTTENIDTMIMGLNYSDLVVAIPKSCFRDGCMMKILEDMIRHQPGKIFEKQQNIAKVATLFSYGMDNNAMQYPDAVAAMLVQARHYVNSIYTGTDRAERVASLRVNDASVNTKPSSAESAPTPPSDLASSGNHYKGPLKCALWDVNLDDWWQIHPDWEPFQDNLTHTCFRPIQNPQQAQFLKEVNHTQYNGKGCGELRSRDIVGAGYGSVMERLTSSFWSAFRDGVPFESTKHRESFHWMYVPPPSGTPGLETNNSWASCPAGDHTCYFLPISSCSAEVGRPESPLKPKHSAELKREKPRKHQYAWLQGYMTRPKQEVRKRLAELMASEAPTLPRGSNCTWIHVRRGDFQSDEGHFRNFYALSEYLEKGGISPGETVLLLTDDEMAVEEAQHLHPQYNWLYFNRTRHRGMAEWNSHIPSNDPAREVLILLAETELAGRCSKGVYASSKITQVFKNSMIRHRDHNSPKQLQLVKIDKDPEEGGKVTASDFMKELEAKLLESKKSLPTVAPTETPTKLPESSVTLPPPMNGLIAKASQAPTPSPVKEIEIVVGNCHDDLTYLDYFGNCDRIHIHIYSPCGGRIPIFTNVTNCVTVHDQGPNCGRETFAYFDYIYKRYETLPSMIAFLQGGAYTENHHIVHDVLHYLEGTLYSDLSRVVKPVQREWLGWNDPERDNLWQELAPHLLKNETGSWITGWRSQFLASRETIRQVPRSAFAKINEMMCNATCNTEVQGDTQCSTELWLGPMFHCAPYDYRSTSSYDAAVTNYSVTCTQQEHDMALPIVPQDYHKDAIRKGMRKQKAKSTTQITCIHKHQKQHSPSSSSSTTTTTTAKTILYSVGTLNGMMTCLSTPTNWTLSYEEINQRN